MVSDDSVFLKLAAHLPRVNTSGRGASAVRAGEAVRLARALRGRRVPGRIGAIRPPRGRSWPSVWQNSGATFHDQSIGRPVAGGGCVGAGRGAVPSAALAGALPRPARGDERGRPEDSSANWSPSSSRAPSEASARSPPRSATPTPRGSARRPTASRGPAWASAPTHSPPRPATSNPSPAPPKPVSTSPPPADRSPRRVPRGSRSGPRLAALVPDLAWPDTSGPSPAAGRARHVLTVKYNYRFCDSAGGRRAGDGATGHGCLNPRQGRGLVSSTSRAPGVAPRLTSERRKLLLCQG